MPNWVVQVGQLLLSLSLLVFLHEWGHYIAARIFKTRVEKFYLFFDFLFPFPNLAKFSLFKFKRGDTEWGIGWFPLGGYVKIAGMLDESADKEAMKLPPKPDEFRSKKAWQRLIIILGGIIVNLILGIVLFIMVKFVWGDTYIPYNKTTVAVEDSLLLEAGFRSGDRILDYKWYGDLQTKIIFSEATSLRVERDGDTMSIPLPTDIVKHIMKDPKAAYFTPQVPFVIDEVKLDSKNYLAGFEKGDRIIMVDTVPVGYIDEYRTVSENYKNENVTITVQRQGQPKVINATLNDKGQLEVVPMDPLELNRLDSNLMPLVHVRYSFGQAIPEGFNAAVNTIKNYVKQFKLIFTPSTGAYKQVRGFGGMASMFPEEWDWESFWKLTAILSLVLAFMNFLPIPMLDGGYMMFILWEMIRGKPPGEKFMTIANNVGFIIVMGLLVYANGNDIIRGIAKLFG